MSSIGHIIEFETMGDERGSLISLEWERNVPFVVNRTYYIFGTKPDVSRGFHAHKELEQIAICLAGSCDILLDDGFQKKNFHLSKPDQGLYINKLIWREMHNFSHNCILLILASKVYDEADYIRQYDLFLRHVADGSHDD